MDPTQQERLGDLVEEDPLVVGIHLGRGVLVELMVGMAANLEEEEAGVPLVALSQLTQIQPEVGLERKAQSLGLLPITPGAEVLQMATVGNPRMLGVLVVAAPVVSMVALRLSRDQ